MQGRLGIRQSGPPMSPQLTFCTNIFHGTTWVDHFAGLQAEIPDLQAKLSYGPLTQLGLRLSATAAEDLAQPAHLAAFEQWLADQGLTVPVINGFPFGDFHGMVVKDKVHEPDWTTSARLDYTCQLAELLVKILPDEVLVGGISSSPISYAPWFQDEPMRQWETLVTAARQLGHWVVIAAKLNQSTSKLIRLELEPEPDGLLDDLQNTISFFQEYLWVYGKEVLMSGYECNEEEALQLLQRHVAICFDVCHFAVLHIPVVEALKALDQAGISIGRVQLSAALVAKDANGLEALRPFDEPNYLHQAAVLLPNGKIKRFQDLGPALDWCTQNPDLWSELRTHYHVPLFCEEFGPLSSTQAAVSEAIQYVKAQIPGTILEVETYTWGILPSELQIPIQQSIARELNWVQDVWQASS